MVFTSRIEVFGVKPDFRFSFIINQFHNDLFLKGLLYFQKTHSCIFERTRQTQFCHNSWSFCPDFVNNTVLHFFVKV